MALLIHALIQHGWGLCAVGRNTDGFPLIERGLVLADTHRVLYFHSLWLFQLAQAHLWNKESATASALASRIIEHAPAVGDLAHLPWGYYIAGEAAAASADPVVAENHYGKALTMAESRSMRPLLAHCRAGLATLYRATGRRSDSDEYAQTATVMYDDMGMIYWREKLENALSAPP